MYDMTLEFSNGVEGPNFPSLHQTSWPGPLPHLKIKQSLPSRFLLFQWLQDAYFLSRMVCSGLLIAVAITQLLLLRTIDSSVRAASALEVVDVLG